MPKIMNNGISNSLDFTNTNNGFGWGVLGIGAPTLPPSRLPSLGRLLPCLPTHEETAKHGCTMLTLVLKLFIHPPQLNLSTKWTLCSSEGWTSPSLRDDRCHDSNWLIGLSKLTLTGWIDDTCLVEWVSATLVSFFGESEWFLGCYIVEDIMVDVR